MPSSPNILRLGTRGSLLARMQSQIIASEFEKLHPGVAIEIVIVKTTGDIIADKPLHDVGGKGLFTKELEQALLSDEVDFAVHSFKDVPVTMPLVDAKALVLAATPKREDPRDVLVCRSFPPDAKPPELKRLPHGATVGTGSLRRRCQLLARRPDLIIQPLRGNIDSRLRKMEAGEHDAVVLALAGLRRTRLFDETRMHVLEFSEMLPAAGQGALALQCRAGDARTREILASVHHTETDQCVRAERELVGKLGGDCHSPIAAFAEIDGETMTLRAVVGARDGGLPVVSAESSGARDRSSDIVNYCWEILGEQNVQALLHGDGGPGF